MAPFEVQLALRYVDPSGRTGVRDLARVEPESSLDRFGVHRVEVLGDKRNRRALIPEPDQLRMVPIAFRLVLQNRLGKQSLPPQRDQPACVEMPGMDAPQTHTVIFGSAAQLDKAPPSDPSSNSSSASTAAIPALNKMLVLDLARSDYIEHRVPQPETRALYSNEMIVISGPVSDF